MYKKISLIHRSKQSTVWLCEMSDGGRAVCKELRTDPKVYEKLRASECDYIPRIYEINVTCDNEGGQPLLEIIEEYIEGKTLQELSLSHKEAVRTAILLCRAVDGLHSLGIIHRDIKPSNIMLDTKGCLKIVDLSSARLFKEEMDRDTVCLGTEGFAAPEQYGFAQTDFRTDIFAVGQTLRLIFENSRRFPVGYITDRCTSFDPDKRFKSCRSIALLLRLAQPVKLCACLAAAAATAITVLCLIPQADTVNVPASAAPVSTEAVQLTDTSDTAASVSESSIDPDYDYGNEELRLSLEAEYAPSAEGCVGSDISEGFIFGYDIYTDHIVITSYNGDAAEAVIPDELDGLPVTEIADSAFASRKITSLTVPDSVRVICPAAFSMCTSLETVSLGANVEYIGKEAFAGCEKLCTVNMGDKVRYIGDRCFGSDARLEKIIMPDTVEYLGEGAFFLCNLRYFNIPAGVRVIKPYTFNGKPYSEDDGPYMVYLPPYIEEDTSIKEKTIPSTVKKIEHDAFSGISSLEKVTVEEGVEVISASAFHNCPMQDHIWVNETKAERECVFKLYLPEDTVITGDIGDISYEIIRS